MIAYHSMEWPHIETYLKLARLVWDERSPEMPANQLIVPETIEHWVAKLGDTINSIQAQNAKLFTLNKIF